METKSDSGTVLTVSCVLEPTTTSAPSIIELARMVSTRASAKSKPRGKPSKVAEPEKPVSQDASTSFVIAPGKVDHVVQEVPKEEIKKPDVVDPTLEFFMMNKAPNPWQKQRAPSVPKPKRQLARVFIVFWTNGR